MVDAVIEVMADGSQQAEVSEINPFRAQHGETLPENVERNFSGFLVRTNALVFKVDTQKLQIRIAMLRDQLVIAKFVGPKPSPQTIGQWLQTLNHELRGSQLSFCRDVGKGYFFVQEMKKMLYIMPHCSPHSNQNGVQVCYKLGNNVLIQITLAS